MDEDDRHEDDGEGEKEVLDCDGTDVGVLVVVDVEEGVREGRARGVEGAEVLHYFLDRLTGRLGGFDVVRGVPAGLVHEAQSG